MATMRNLIDLRAAARRGAAAAAIASCLVMVCGSLYAQAMGQAQDAGSLAAPGAAAQQVPTTYAAPTPTEPLQNLPISGGDLLDVEVFNTPELSGHFRVDQLGRVALPLGGSVSVKGMSTVEAAQAIGNQLKSSQIMLAPAVNVSIVEYSSAAVTVLGEVRIPGIYTLIGPRSLYDVLASAGGPSASQGSSITITRAHDPDHPITVPVDTSGYSVVQKTTLVSPGDTVIVNRAPLVYVVGDVMHSGAYYLQVGQKLTVIDAVSLSDGVQRTAAMSAVKILRETPSGVQTVRMNLTKVLRNEELNPVLQAGDVLVIPRSGFKTFAYTVSPALTNTLSNAVTTALITH